jgi:hypothetical protein
MTSRRIVTRRGNGVRGKFMSAKTGTMIHWESTLERDACRLLEFSLGLRSYGSQPEKFEVPTEVGTFAHFPDFGVCTIDGAIGYMEVKPKAKLLDPAVAMAQTRLRNYLEAQGYFYVILTEDEIRREPRFSNLSRLLQYRSPRPRQLSNDEARHLPDVSATFGELKKSFSLLELLRLLADQVLVFDLHSALQDTTELWQPEEEHDAQILIF